jgi:hypothetical protein
LAVSFGKLKIINSFIAQLKIDTNVTYTKKINENVAEKINENVAEKNFAIPCNTIYQAKPLPKVGC